MRLSVFAIALGAVFCAIPQRVAMAQSIAPAAIVKCRPKSGDVLLAGGFNGHQVTAAAEFFDPLTERFSRTCSNMSAPRYRAQTILVNQPEGEPGNHVLVLGGAERAIFFNTTDVWESLTGKFQSGPNMEAEPDLGNVVELADGRLSST